MSTTTFKGVSNIGDAGYSEILRDNLISFMDWAFLETGAFFNVTIPTSGAYGGDRHILHVVSDPRYTDGQIWQAYRQNWVWESGMSMGNPIPVSGVYVDDVFIANSGSFTINYPEGRIIFDTAIDTGSTVKVAYSHKWIKVVASQDIPWFQEAHTRSFRLDEDSYTTGSGIWSQTSQTRLELPVVAVEVLDNKTYEGYQLGGSQWVRNDVILHIIAEDDSMSLRLSDILSQQKEKTIFLFDTNRIANNDAFPLQYNGSKSSNPMVYPDLVKHSGDGGYRYTSGIEFGKMWIIDSQAGSNQRLNSRLYHSTVRWRTEAISQKI